MITAAPRVLHSRTSKTARLYGTSKQFCVLEYMRQKTISFALPGLEAPQMARRILMSFGPMATIWDACSPMAWTMVATTLHLSSKFPMHAVYPI